MGYLIKQNQTARPLVFLLVDATDHVTPLTGLSPTVTLSKNGAAFGASAGVVSEIGNGWYKVAGNAADSDTLGPLLLHATAAGADPTDDRFDVVAADPHEARVDVGKWLGTAVATPNVNGVPLIDIGYVIGQPASTTSGPIDANVTQVAGQVASAAGAVDFGNLDSAVSSRVATSGLPTNFGALAIDGVGRVTPLPIYLPYVHAGTAQAGGATTITLASTASSQNDAYNDSWIFILAGTGAGQPPAIVSDYVGSTKVATVPGWAVTPDNTSVYGISSTVRVGYVSTQMLGEIASQVWSEGGRTLSSNGLDGITIETGVNARQAISAIAAACAGEASGLDTAMAVYDAIDNAGTPRITATVDTNGNRSAVTLDLPS